jgi:hypothetical protein
MAAWASGAITPLRDVRVDNLRHQRRDSRTNAVIRDRAQNRLDGMK